MKYLKYPAMVVAVVLALVLGAAPAQAALPTAYFPTSPSWSTPLPAGTLPLDAGNSQMKSNWSWQNHDGSFWSAYGPPIYEVTEADQLINISCTSSICAQSGMNNVTSWRAPSSGPIPGTSSDHWIAIVNTETRQELDLWNASWDPATNTLTGQGGGIFNVDTGTGWVDCSGPPYWCSSATASGAALTAGIITPADMRAGVINHAIAFVPRWVRANFTACPATHNDGAGWATDPPEGARFFIPRSYKIPADWASKPGGRISAMIVKALQEYGGFVMDQGSWTFRYQANGDYSGTDLANGPVHYPRGWWYGEVTAFPWDQINFLPITNCGVAANQQFTKAA